MQRSSSLTVTDQFCGAGGSSVGATQAGAELKTALNHWKLAIETHNSNFPNALHDCTDISACDPRRYPSTDILLTSPECTNHSLAKGKKRKNQAQLNLWEPTILDPSEERSRATMWDVPRFAEVHDYNLIIVENVVDARHWRLFDSWLHAMQALDYRWEIVYYNSMFAPPTPQSRDRMYVVFWKKGNPAPNLRFTPPAYCPKCDKCIEAVQSWKSPSRQWGRYGKSRQYVYRCPYCAQEIVPFYYAAANAVNWELPIQRIGDRQKPLKARTMQRIDLGLQRFASDPVLIELGHGSTNDSRVRLVTDPTHTQTTAQTIGLLSPFIVGLDHTQATGNYAYPVERSWPTQTARQDKALVVPYILDLLWEYRSRSVTDPLTTVVAGGNHHGLVFSPPVSSSFLVSYYGKDSLHSISDPLGTITTVDRHALVTPDVRPETRIEDCYFRMLQPEEVGRAMAFPTNYVVLGTARQKVRQYGNAITPPVMKMLLERCIQTLQ